MPDADDDERSTAVGDDEVEVCGMGYLMWEMRSKSKVTKLTKKG